jgi:probable HAF family extracellular repeat protein
MRSFIDGTLVLMVSALVMAAPRSAHGQTLLDLQNLAISDQFNSQAFAVSGDGRVIGGRGRPAQDAWILDDAFMATFVAPSFAPSVVNDLSVDGSVAVGTAAADHAFRWTSATGGVALGDLAGGGGASYATGVSADGAVVTGAADSPGGTLSFLEAFRWTLANAATGAGAMVGLGDLPGGDEYSAGAAISQDGAVIVGGASSAASHGGGAGFFLSFEAFRWTQATGMVPLGDLPGGGYYSFANACSADGSTIVGASTSTASGISELEAFRWTAGTGMVGLGDLPGGRFHSFATGVSADGSIVIGASAVAIGDGGLDIYAPFIWDAVNGMRNLQTVFNALGLALPELAMTNATAISDDGRTITGFGKSVFRTPAGDLRTEAWLGILPPSFQPADFDENGAVDGLDLARWQANFGLAAGALHAQGDADGDQDVDGADFLVWQRQLNAVNAVAAPEPKGSTFLIIAAAAMLPTSRWR